MKRTIAIVCGGDTSEFQVSLRSAQGIYSFIDKEKYTLYIVEMHGLDWHVQLPDGGKALSAVLVGLRGALDASRDFDAEVLRRLAELRYLTTTLCAACAVPGADPALATRGADDFLRAVALVLLAWAWSQILATSTAPPWSAPAQALRAWVLPELDMRLAIIRQQMATPLHNNATA